jgi:hypothetical protein
MVAILLIAVGYAAGLAVYYRWYERLAAPSLSFDQPVDAPPNSRKAALDSVRPCDRHLVAAFS